MLVLYYAFRYGIEAIISMLVAFKLSMIFYNTCDLFLTANS
jgi:hypothetical protein